MSLPNDLKHYRADDDPFVILSGDACVLILCALIVVGIILAPYLSPYL